MKALFPFFFLFLPLLQLQAETRTIHVFVALCDNVHQGIVPVPKSLGNGQDPKNNLYWGAAYGMKSFFKYKTTDWTLVKSLDAENPMILERVLFKHKTKDVYMLADAYDGEKIKNCTEHFLKASNQQNPFQLNHEGQTLSFGGAANLLAYIGHDGLMDFSLQVDYKEFAQNDNEVIILACYSKRFFSPQIQQAGAKPLLWTTHLMAPEAYTLKAAIDGWLAGESGASIDERAAQAYNSYQKCGIKGARNLFTTGY